MLNKTLIYAEIFILSTFISSISQIMLKKSAFKKYNSIVREYLNPIVIIAYGIFLSASLLTIYAYKFVPLSMGPILESTGYIFVSVLSYFFLKERLRKRKLIGMVLILLGILVFNIKN